MSCGVLRMIMFAGLNGFVWDQPINDRCEIAAKYGQP